MDESTPRPGRERVDHPDRERVVIRMAGDSEETTMNVNPTPERTHQTTGLGRGRRRQRTRALTAVALVATAVTLAACSSGGSTGSSSSGGAVTTTTGTAGGSTTTVGSPTSGATADSITIKNFAFSPSAVTVAPGATVTVTNRDQVAHTVTAMDGRFNTGDIAPGRSETFTAPNTAGSYPYICSIHQYMTGTLTVS